MEKDILKTKTVKIALDGFGSYLGMEKGRKDITRALGPELLGKESPRKDDANCR
jgi:hypothetical protein